MDNNSIHGFRGLIATTVGSFCCLFSVAAMAADAKSGGPIASPGDPVSFDGVWFPYQPEGFDFKPHPELTPTADKFYKEVRASMAKGKVIYDSTGRCVPPGLPRIMNRVYPNRIIRTPTDMVQLFEYENQIRFIHMDGRKHPPIDDILPSFNGYSIGHWEGETLVIDTIGLKEEAGGWPTQVNNGIKISPNLHVVEHWTLSPDGKLITVNLTLTDPEVFVNPWQTQKRFQRRDDLELLEYTCLPDENPVTVDESGATQFKQPGGATQ